MKRREPTDPVSPRVYCEPKRREVCLEDPTKAPLHPTRIDFIDRLTSTFFEGAEKPFVFSEEPLPTGYSRNVPPHYRVDFVHLKIPCDRFGCKLGEHVIRIVCFPVEVGPIMPDKPTEAMMFAPYSVSLSFWRRVQLIEIDGYYVFNQGNQFEPGNERNAFIFRVRFEFLEQCFQRIIRTLDLFYTLVIDHIFTLTHLQVMPRYMDSIAMFCPHAIIAHGHRWGATFFNRLRVFPNTYERDVLFWAVYDAACARMQLPTTVDTAHFIHISTSDCYPNRQHHVDDVTSSFGQRFPRVRSVEVGYTADFSFVTKAAEAFPNVPIFMFGVSESSITKVTLPQLARFLGFIRANRRMEECVVTFPYPLHIDHRGNRARVALLEEMCDAVGWRRSLLLLASADFTLTTRFLLLQDVVHKIKPWTAFFSNMLFERQTMKLVRQFLYKTDNTMDECLATMAIAEAAVAR